MNDCKCKVEISCDIAKYHDCHGDEEFSTIDFCPLHQAAPELVRDVKELIGILEATMTPAQRDGDMGMAVVTVSEALAHADPQEEPHA